MTSRPVLCWVSSPPETSRGCKAEVIKGGGGGAQSAKQSVLFYDLKVTGERWVYFKFKHVTLNLLLQVY